MKYQIDFNPHSRYSSGYGHFVVKPGKPSSGHVGSSVDQYVRMGLINPDYLIIPEGVEYATPLGTPIGKIK